MSKNLRSFINIQRVAQTLWSFNVKLNCEIITENLLPIFVFVGKLSNVTNLRYPLLFLCNIG